MKKKKRKRIKNKKPEHVFVKIFKLLKLEITTSHGKVNLAGVIVVTFFCLLYTASDVLRHLISATEDTIKSVALKTDIYHPYETSDVVKAVIPIIIIFVGCLYYLYLHEKNKIKTDENNEEKN